MREAAAGGTTVAGGRQQEGQSLREVGSRKDNRCVVGGRQQEGQLLHDVSCKKYNFCERISKGLTVLKDSEQRVN